MPGTLSHAQSQIVTRAELMAIAPPRPTATWRPIAHGDLITALDRQLLVRGITIHGEQYAIQRDGARLFAVLNLVLERTDEFTAAMGIRTANDRSMALEIAVGVRVFVCDQSRLLGRPHRASPQTHREVRPECRHLARGRSVSGASDGLPSNDRRDPRDGTLRRRCQEPYL
jgi:hypothetical protein